VLVDAEQPAGGGAQVAVQAGLGGDDPAQLGPLGRRELGGAGDRLGELGEQPRAGRLVAVGGLGLWQMTNRSAWLIRTSLTRRLPATCW